jgi:hypothetical protein
VGVSAAATRSRRVNHAGQPPYRLVPNVIWDRNAFRMRKGTLRILRTHRNSRHTHVIGSSSRGGAQYLSTRPHGRETPTCGGYEKGSSPMSCASLPQQRCRICRPDRSPRHSEVTTVHSSAGKRFGSEQHSRPSTGNTATGTAAGRLRSRMALRAEEPPQHAEQPDTVVGTGVTSA